MEPHQVQWVLEEIRKATQSATDQIIGGGAVDHAAYRNACGVIRGLNAAREIILEAIRDAEEQNA